MTLPDLFLKDLKKLFPTLGTLNPFSADHYISHSAEAFLKENHWSETKANKKLKGAFNVLLSLGLHNLLI